MNGVTLCVTSCGRPDLLRATLDSLLATNSFEQKLLVEDDGDEHVAAYLKEIGWGDGLIMHDTRQGQMRSIDDLYARVTTPYIFHCEDDWLFDAQDLIAPCKSVLAAEPKISMVCVRKIADLPPVAQRALVRREVAGVRYGVIPPDAHPEWFGFTFNPGLSRADLWQRYGPYAGLSEVRISLAMKQDRLTCAFLDPGACRHIGGEAHVADPFQPRRPTSVLGRLGRSVGKRIERLKRRLDR